MTEKGSVGLITSREEIAYFSKAWLKILCISIYYSSSYQPTNLSLRFKKFMYVRDSKARSVLIPIFVGMCVYKLGSGKIGFL